MKKKVIVVGAGPGGLSAAMKLAYQGFQVEVYEKQHYIGGRNGAFQLGEYTFDIGPTFLSMVHLAEELFQSVGKNIHDYMTLIPLEPMYELRFPDKTLTMSSNREVMLSQITKYFPGNEEGYERFMHEQEEKLEKLTPILQTKMDQWYHYLSKRVLSAIPTLTLTKTLYDVLSTYFTEEQLRLAFTFQSKYLGMSPWECPGAFSILSYMEHGYGIVHPIGGVNQLSHGMAKVVEELGGTIHLGKGIQQILIKDKSAYGVRLDNGEEMYSDVVVVNTDFGHMATELIPEGVLTKYSPKKLEKKKLSCSTFMLYLGVNTTYDLPHHTIVFAEDYKKNVEEITGTFTLPIDPSIYIQNASVTDTTLAPAGKSTLYILAPVPNNKSNIDWEKEKERFKELILQTLEQRTEFKDIRSHIEEELILTPKEWEKEIYVYKGATFNLGHQLNQMMYLRPHNEFEEVKNLYLVGGGTHPGSGLPTILESGKISATLITEKYTPAFPTSSKQEVTL